MEIKWFKEYQKFGYKKFYSPIGKMYFYVEGREKRIYITHYSFRSPFGSLRIDIKPKCI